LHPQARLAFRAPADSIELEIKPYALEQIEKVRAAFEGRKFEALETAKDSLLAEIE